MATTSGNASQGQAEWITYAEAARRIGCAQGTVTRLVREGVVNQRPDVRRGAASLASDSVTDATRVWQQHREERERCAAEREERRPAPPDDDQVWLSASEAAAVLDVSSSAVRQRIKRGTMPATWNRGRWWLRRSDIEILAAAKVFRARASSC